MAVKMMSTNGQISYDHNEYILDTPADLAKLPKNVKQIGMGSMAFVISTATLYVMNSKGEWVEVL